MLEIIETVLEKAHSQVYALVHYTTLGKQC